MLSIIVNGDTQSVEPDATVADLLERLKMNPKFLAVELNRRVVPRGLLSTVGQRESELGRSSREFNDRQRCTNELSVMLARAGLHRMCVTLK